MTPAELRKIGRTLYGPRWQSEMARNLGYCDRTIRYWLSGDWPIKQEQEDAIFDLVKKSVEQLKKIRGKK